MTKRAMHGGLGQPGEGKGYAESCLDTRLEALLSERARRRSELNGLEDKVLASLDLGGKIVMGDAMQTQRDLSAQIIEAAGLVKRYVLGGETLFDLDILQLPLRSSLQGGRIADRRQVSKSKIRRKLR